ncbi:unnamed protein product [Protopolystoma xenopodis]|uniref:Zinc finger PHD-type domain-containing protein n=1 Tax=Protopolystoma xenopodis TaxID=117903 RepID=A0A3S5CP55_9PLAT|nr:unnamed protein product [Protopolystoma xenopodis]
MPGRKSTTGKTSNVPTGKRGITSGGAAGRKSGGGSSGQSGTANELFHYDTEECSARPCKQPQDNAIDWIQCDKCTLWYHQICIGCKPSEADVETYYCPYCKGTA